ncbi:hypothetical protein EVAR_71313_1 [Eumeta japonica]|uniref:Uncharacterized protein n=1 Tax=Eumeta variegata TaxID=151549 RepID=A0A4C2AAR1_EUMVA|nr:hypothetical protein EVAR_71313_1 [Eumeta japonica]
MCGGNVAVVVVLTLRGRPADDVLQESVLWGHQPPPAAGHSAAAANGLAALSRASTSHPHCPARWGASRTGRTVKP